ncbi:MAG TPA: thioesterase family protein [Syntrophorhabdales bacterium]|nr:thioesterase family protein [Syntrophorhabdales bacterium]
MYEFHYELEVQVGHLNYGGHLGHDSVVRIVHEARVHMFRVLGVAENNLGDNRAGIIMGDLVVSYSGEGYLFDKLRVDSHVGEMGRSGFRMFHRLVRGETLIALVETGLMAYDYALRAIVPVPDAFKRALKQYLESRA